MSEPEVLVTREGGLGILTLNRPAAMNALTHGMVNRLAEALEGWSDDPGIRTVLIRGAGDRGLCAGGDVVSLHAAAVSGDRELPARFWADEYALNLVISRYPKPYVALMDGVVLGGGVGVSAHGSHRIVTERTRLGMPEVGIGFIPDVGGTWLLARAPGELGTRLALTGEMVGAAEAVTLGLADRFVPSDRLESLTEALRDTPADAAIAAVAEPAPESMLLSQKDWHDRMFAGADAEAIIERLRAAGEDGTALADTIASKSPTAVAVALAALRRALEADSLATVLEEEFRVSMHCLAHPDFREGIRAQLIDKDRNPRWQPARLADVDQASVEAFFAPLDGGELDLTTR